MQGSQVEIKVPIVEKSYAPIFEVLGSLSELSWAFRIFSPNLQASSSRILLTFDPIRPQVTVLVLSLT